MSEDQQAKESGQPNAGSGEPTSVGSDELRDLKSFLQTHGVPIALGICLTLAIFLVIGYRRNAAEKRNEEAARILFTAKTPQDLAVVADRHASAPVAPLALLKLAKSQFDSGNYSVALAKYNELKQKYPDHALVEASDIGKAHCLEAMSQFEQAEAAFAEFVAKRPKHYLAPEALLGQARCLEQLNKPREAKALYEDFLTARPDSGWTPRAKELLDAVSAKIAEEATQPPSKPEAQLSVVSGANPTTTNLDLPPIK